MSSLATSALPLPEDAPFIDAIRAALDDDAPRLVYADRLLERGDPRGEFIIVQCRRARLEREGRTGSPEHREAMAREQELLEDYGEVWLWPVSRGRLLILERGLIAEVRMPIEDVQSDWARLSKLPLRTIRLITSRAAINGATLGSIAWLARQRPTIQRLHLETFGGSATFDAATLWPTLADIEESDARPLWRFDAGVPELRAHRAVRALAWRWPTTEMAQELGRAPLISLESLRIDSAERLYRSDWQRLFPRLEGELHAQWIHNEACARAILENAPPRLKLTQRDRRPWSRPLTDGLALPNVVALEGDVILPRDVAAPKLEELKADHGVEDLPAFLASELPSRLRVLWLKSDTLGAIAQTPFPELQDLHVFPAHPTEAEAAALVASPHLPKLARLQLEFQHLTPETRAILRQRWPVDG